MLMLNLWRQLAARHAVFLLFSSILLGLFEFLLNAIVSTMNLSGAFEELMKTAPAFLRSMIGEEFLGGLTSRGMLAFGWNHPIAQALGAAVAIVLGSRAIAGEIESGVMELVLSQPLSRMSYMMGQIAFATSALGVLSFAGVAGTLAGQSFFGLEGFEAQALVKLWLNFFLLQSAWFGLTLVFSVFGREGGRVSSAAFLLVLLSYLVQAIGRLWSPAAFLLPYSLHSYYSPQAILVEQSPIGKSLSLLLSVSAICAGFAVWRFHRRDIP